MTLKPRDLVILIISQNLDEVLVFDNISRQCINAVIMVTPLKVCTVVAQEFMRGMCITQGRTLTQVDGLRFIKVNPVSLIILFFHSFKLTHIWSDKKCYL